ncbi:uncharacterized protein BX663DRAFT_514469 [Cokeromyces recurvatus]|uniref:uncharacterized protein n=1 Tax=Cokeromyces recurvatus TaxID=90255 RepID=UPI00222112A2|nr:uncharacterized protein BX663DRAFT_514469 [Cokeromyces recurvatus]KAI7901454.1 hypothetical protein BX663DRAFT_514469 [Cokeromyces recurvatus]
MVHYIHDDLISQGSLSSSSSTYSSASSLDDHLSTTTTNTTTNTIANASGFTLSQVLSNPKLLCAFECFLRQTWSHENLLFIEAITQLKHESDPKSVEPTLHRIYKTFLAHGSPLELHVTTQDQVRDDIRSLEWAIVDRVDAVTILEETEAQVLDILKVKLAEFARTMELHSGNVSPSKIQNQQISVVIVGGGFTGFTVASILDQMPRFYVTLIDTKDSFEYTPGIVKKIINPEQTSSLRVRHDAYVKNGRVIIGFAEDLSNEGKTVTVNQEVITFDYLVVATGSAYSSQLKSTDTSSLYRMSGLEESYLELLKARSVLIIGGGLVGCELASEISQHRFPGAHPKKEVTLVDSHSNVVNRSDVRQQSVARKYLEDLGVKVICNEKILDFDSTNANSYLGSSGRVYYGFDKVFIATGTRPNNNLFTSSTDSSLDNCIDAWGRIKVKPTLQLDHYKYNHIFAGGDVTNVVEEKTGYAATISGVCIARNICRLVKGKLPLKQGTKGTLPAPHKPLHGMLEHGGIGKQNLNNIKKKFSFLNPSWAALKYFDEQQFLRIVQGQGSINSSQVLGRLPRKLNLPSDYNSRSSSLLQHSRTKTSFSSSVLSSHNIMTNSHVSVNNRRHLSSVNTNTSHTPSLRRRSSSQSQPHTPQHYERSGSRLEALRKSATTSSNSSSSNVTLTSIKSNSSVVSSNSSHSISSKRNRPEKKIIPVHLNRSQSKNIPASINNAHEEQPPQEEKLKSLEGLLFEHFTYGGEDIKLFSTNPQHPVATCSSPVSPIAPSPHPQERIATEQKISYPEKPSYHRHEPEIMAYDTNFQLSPPPPKRRASLTTHFKDLSCYDTKQGVKLTRSPSFSSIIHQV